MFIDQKLIFLCISEELGLLMDWVIYFVYHYVDLLDHWKMSSWLFSSSLLVPTRMTKPFEGRFFIRGFQSVPPMQEVWGKQVFTSLHALHITQPHLYARNNQNHYPWALRLSVKNLSGYRIKSDKPQTQNCNTMAPNICWPKIVRTKLDKAYLNQKAAESIDDIHLQ